MSFLKFSAFTPTFLVAAERALHQLDVYKTPLLPTRLRSSNLPASVTATKTPEMFKSRRSAHLILMQDDSDRQVRKVSGPGKSPIVNETKPYAGEGGMKKLLARRKQEEEEENEQEHGDQPTPRPPSPPIVPAEIPPIPSGSDWFSVGPSEPSTTGSSLRVGRSKTSRNHIQRPSKARFSAVYDEEADDTAEDDEARQKERQMLEEAAKKVPVFKVSPDFTFARDVRKSCFLILMFVLTYKLDQARTNCRLREGEGAPNIVAALFFL